MCVFNLIRSVLLHVFRPDLCRTTVIGEQITFTKFKSMTVNVLSVNAKIDIVYDI